MLRMPTRQGRHNGSPLPPHAPLEMPHQCRRILASPEKCSHSFRRRAPEQLGPSHSPCLLNTPLHEWCFALCTSLGQPPVRNPFVSFENLLPTSTTRTTSRARACTPTNSRHLRSLALLAARRATPSISAAPLRDLPSP